MVSTVLGKPNILFECICCCIVYLIVVRFPERTAHLDEQEANISSSHRNHLIISADGHVRNCLTGDVIGQEPKRMSTGPLVGRTDDGHEDTKSRAASFQKIFDKKVWGQFDTGYKGLQASGKISTLADLAQSKIIFYT